MDVLRKHFGKKEDEQDEITIVTNDNQEAGDETSLHPVAASLSTAFKRISTGNLMPELLVSSHTGGVDEVEMKSAKASAAIVDVIVVGGGLSGLSAAYSLRNANQGISLLVLEANNRVGGRLMTQDLESNAGRDFWDLGSRWIGGSQIHMMQLTEELELHTYTQTELGSNIAYHHTDGRKVTFEALAQHPLSSVARMDYNTFISKVEKLRLELSLEAPHECLMALEWDSVTLEQFRKQHIWTTVAQQYFDVQIQLIFGVPPREMSTLFFLFALTSAGGWNSLFQTGSETTREFRIKGGSQRLCEILADKINRSVVKLGDPVVSINQTDTDLTHVQTLKGNHYRCERVIMAVPPQSTAGIHYSPPMPPDRNCLLQRMPSGRALHFVVTYREAFWQKLGFSGHVIQMTTPANSKPQANSKQQGQATVPFTALYDATTMDQSPALEGIVTTTNLRDMSVEERRSVILHGIEVFFGVEALDPLDYADMDWTVEPYSSSCHSSVISTGAMTGYFQELTKPFDRIHWAGAETTVRWFGFMDGAVYSGKRAAEEVIAKLRPEAVIGV